MTGQEMPCPDVFCAMGKFGMGRTVYITDAAMFSRKFLGHCFAKPTVLQTQLYETVYLLFEEYVDQLPQDRRFYGIL
jgi:hypothetical protein